MAVTPRIAPAETPWPVLTSAAVVSRLRGDAERGLASGEARRRRALVGLNRLGGPTERPLWSLALGQFRSLVVVLLLAAAVVAWGLGERPEALAILGALIVNAVIGFAAEARARRSIARLRSLAVPRAIVRRDGQSAEIAAAELVPGDLIALEAGAAVPADARLLRSAALRVSEAALTGESAPVDKDADAVSAPGAPLAERPTMVYLGTAILSGSGLAIVTATGFATELGRIGQLVALAGERTTPLERQVEQLGRRLLAVGIGVCALVAVLGVLHGEPAALMLETAITLAVAAIPEGLPALTAVALAGGLWRLARAGALVRRLAAVESLGSTTVICADKTGTMTENQMTVTRLYLAGRSIQVWGGGRSPTGTFVEAGAPVDPRADRALALLLTVGALVNDAVATADGAELRLLGDPTESALLVAALKAGLDPVSLARAWPRRREMPFDPGTRLMATFHEAPGHGRVVLVKGAPAAVLERATTHLGAGGVVGLSPADREVLLEANRSLAAQGLRVLAVAWQPGGWPEGNGLGPLTFLGLVGLADPVRPEVPGAIARCREAGIRTVMLTGDQRATAEAVGRALGLEPEAIHSRVSPEEKLRLVERLQAAGEIVAMTGDGVNDAPALARADIGVAMGRLGTDVAREAADMVLTDDNFATIARAVEEGRVIYGNLRKVIHFLFSCNASEILTILVAILIGFPAPLLPLQILWVNLVTDILPAVALIRDPAEPDIMRRPPRQATEALVTWTFGARTLAEGALLAAGVLSAYLFGVWRHGVGPTAGALAFCTLVVVHPFQAIYCRSERLGWWRLPSNGLMWTAFLALLGMQYVAVSWRPLAGLLDAVAPSAGEWGVIVLSALWPVLVLEGAKGLRVEASAQPSPRASGSGGTGAQQAVP